MNSQELKQKHTELLRSMNENYGGFNAEINRQLCEIERKHIVLTGKTIYDK